MPRSKAPLVAQILDFLGSKPDVAVVGPLARGGGGGGGGEEEDRRLPIVSFVHRLRSAAELTAAAHAARVAVRHGHMYSRRLLEGLGHDGDAGVCRLSLCHYNTAEEVDRWIEAVDPIL